MGWGYARGFREAECDDLLPKHMLGCVLWVVWICFGLGKWILLGKLLSLLRVSSARVTVDQAYASEGEGHL
jgi:hypothetical protein